MDYHARRDGPHVDSEERVFDLREIHSIVDSSEERKPAASLEADSWDSSPVIHVQKSDEGYPLDSSNNTINGKPGSQRRELRGSYIPKEELEKTQQPKRTMNRKWTKALALAPFSTKKKQPGTGTTALGVPGKGNKSPTEPDSQLPIEDTDTRQHEASRYWIPQATPDGQLFYFNTRTRDSTMELPIDLVFEREQPVPRIDTTLARNSFASVTYRRSGIEGSGELGPSLSRTACFTCQRRKQRCDRGISGCEFDRIFYPNENEL